MLLQKLFALSLVLWMFFQTGVTPTSQPSPEKPDKSQSEELSPELKEKALKLLRAVGRETQQFAASENRVKMSIVINELLWRYDETAARAGFNSTLVELQNQLAEIGSMPQDESGSQYGGELYTKKYAFAELRREYVLALAPHDPQAALTALQALKTENANAEDYDPLADQQLELQLAAAVAKKDPAKAYELAKKQLSEGVSYNLLETLKDMFKQNPETAARLAKDILAAVKSAEIKLPSNANTNMATNGNMANVSSSSNGTGRAGRITMEFWEVVSFLATAVELNRQAARHKDKKTPLLSDGDMKELAELVALTFLNDKNPTPYIIGSAMPSIKQYAPALATRIRAKLGAEMSAQLDQMSEYGTYYSEMQDKTADELTQDAERAAPDQRDMRLAAAVAKAIEEGEPEKAQTIHAKIKDKKSYSYVLEQIEAALPLAKARRGDLEAVRNVLSTLGTNEERIAALAELASTVAKKGDKEAAKKLLDEAAGMFTGRLKSQKTLTSSILMSSAYALAAPEQGFVMLENNIAQMNEVINAGIMLEEFYDYGSMRNDELLYSAINRQGLMHVENSVDLLKNLAKADFERTESLSERFQRAEIRTFVRLKLARALLDPEAAERDKTEREQAQGEHDH